MKDIKDIILDDLFIFPWQTRLKSSLISLIKGNIFFFWFVYNEVVNYELYFYLVAKFLYDFKYSYGYI